MKLQTVKIAAVLLVLCMLLSSSVFAAEGQTRIYSEENITASAGAEFTVPVYIENNPGIFGFIISIAFDKNVIEPVADSEQAGDMFSMVLANPTYLNKPVTWVTAIAPDNVTDDGLLFSYKFRVKEDAAPGETKLTLAVENDSMRRLEQDMTITAVDCAGTVCTVTVGGGSTTNPSTPTPPTATPGAASYALKADAADIAYMAPVSDTVFAPERAATRYEVVEALYELLEFQGLETIDKFPDVDAAHREMVHAFAQTPIIDGYPDGTFGGENNITRAEFVKIVSTAAGLQTDTVLRETFSDVPTQHWANSYIASFVEAGYIYGYPDGTFLPENNITRAEVVAIINRVIGKQKADGAAARFDDLQPGHWAYGDIMAAAK